MTILEKTLDANKQIIAWELGILTWGNVSIISDDRKSICIKPSGVNLSTAQSSDMTLVDMNGAQLSGKKASVDTNTHLEIYKGFRDVGSVVHAHSKYATIFAQANRQIPCLGTTHADYFYGAIPCVPTLTNRQIEKDYEAYTGKVIVEYFLKNDINPNYMQAALVCGHGVFCWGCTASKALENAYVLEYVAELAYKTIGLLPTSAPLTKQILDKHFFRKNGNNKYYGQ